VILLVYIVLTYISKMIHYPLLGMSDTFWTLLLTGLYLAYAFMPMYLNYQYISFSDEGEKIVIRYFNAGIMKGRKNSIEIHKASFAGYRTEKKFFGLMKSIVLYQRMKEGIARYPRVYINVLTKDDQDKIYRALDRHATGL
jgi:hypothetical protein